MNFLGLLIKKSPMEKLLEHHAILEQLNDVIRDSLECYINNGHNAEFKILHEQIIDLESKGDNVIRHVRNNLPRSIFMPVNKVMLLNYTSAQDNILDAALGAFNWLSMRNVAVPGGFKESLMGLAEDVGGMLKLLGPALKDTISLVHLESLDWENAREQYQKIQHKKNEIFKSKQTVSIKVYNSEMEFKDIFLLIHFIEKIFDMSRSCSKCVEILRSMIAR
jgi:uncharacterized protein